MSWNVGLAQLGDTPVVCIDTDMHNFCNLSPINKTETMFIPLVTVEN